MGLEDLGRAKLLQSECRFAKYWLRNFDDGPGQDNCRKTATYLLRKNLWGENQVMEHIEVELPGNPFGREGCSYDWGARVRRVLTDLAPSRSAPAEADPEAAKRYTSAVLKNLVSFPYYSKQRKLTQSRVDYLKEREDKAWAERVKARVEATKRGVVLPETPQAALPDCPF